MTDNERLFLFFDYLIETGKIATQVQLAEVIGTNKAGISDLKSGRKKVTIDNIRSMKKAYPELNFNWMVLEEGGMLVQDDPNVSLVANTQTQSEFILRTDSRTSIQRIPLYDHIGAASLIRVFEGHHNIIDYITIPNLPKSDGAIYISGDSMYPLLKSGDIAIYKRLYDIPGGILFGETYILSVRIDDDLTTVVKYVQKSDKGSDWIKLVSQNSHHAALDFHLSDIVAMGLVKASVRINGMI